MITLNRNKRKIYVCNKVQNLESKDIKKYSEPITLYENYAVTNTEADLESFGMDAYMYLRIHTDISHELYYHLGDRVYVDIVPPEVHDELCKTADYEVYKDPVKSLNSITILLKRRSGR